jgi:hypothetical protein
MKFLNFFIFVGHFYPPETESALGMRNRPKTMRIRIRNIVRYKYNVLLGRDRMGISKQELVSMLEEDELKDAILGKRRIFFPSLPFSSFSPPPRVSHLGHCAMVENLW